MSRTEQEVAAELNRLGCSMNQKGLAALAQDLQAGETILDALGTDSKGSVHAMVLTGKRVFGVTYNPRSWLGEDEYLGVTHLQWQDVEKVYSGEQYGDKKTLLIAVSGPSEAPGVEVAFDREHVDVHRCDKLVEEIQERLAGVSSAPPTPARPVTAAPFARSVAAPNPAAARPSSGTLINDLERLAALRQSGALTQGEFEVAKRKLLLG